MNREVIKKRKKASSNRRKYWREEGFGGRKVIEKKSLRLYRPKRSLDCVKGIKEEKNHMVTKIRDNIMMIMRIKLSVSLS